METFSALLAICAGNSPVLGEFPTERPVTRSFDVFFDLRLNKRLSKQSWDWWFATLSRPLWRHRNENTVLQITGSQDFIHRHRHRHRLQAYNITKLQPEYMHNTHIYISQNNYKNKNLQSQVKW